MSSRIRINVSDAKTNGGDFSYRKVTVREKLLRFVLGKPIKLTVLVPGENVQSVEIHKIDEGGTDNEYDE